jgi:hypothetical protein
MMDHNALEWSIVILKLSDEASGSKIPTPVGKDLNLNAAAI